MTVVPKRLRFALFTLLIYGLFWALTHFAGGAQIRQLTLKAMRAPKGLAGLKEISRPESGPSSPGTYFCHVVGYAPFLVRVDHGWCDGPLSGDGGSELYLWLHGTALRLRELGHWAI